MLSHTPSMKTMLSVFFLRLSLNPADLLISCTKPHQNTKQVRRVQHTPPQGWRIVREGGISRMIGGRSTHWRGFWWVWLVVDAMNSVHGVGRGLFEPAKVISVEGGTDLGPR